MGKSTEVAARADLYRQAARLLEMRAPSTWGLGGVVDYACEAIETALGRNFHGLECAPCWAMREVFDPDHANGHAWLAGISSDTVELEEDRDGRILALCFMAAMVEAGDA